MNDDNDTAEAVLILGCPEVPVQQALALYCAHQYKVHGNELRIAGNTAVLQLLRVSDPGKHYITKVMNLDRCIEDLSTKKLKPSLCIMFIHNDGGVAYAATVRFLFQGRLIVVVFGRDAEQLGAEIDSSCEKIVEVTVHNPEKIRKRLDEVMGWAV